MPRILLLAALIVAIWYWRLQLKGLPEQARRGFLWRSAFWAVLGISVILVVSGKMHWLGAGLAALVPLAKTLFSLSLRTLPLLRMLSRFKTSPSQFRTSSLVVEINFSNRQMDGEVISGDLAGKRLSALSTQQLQELANQFKSVDRESYILLQVYLLRSGNSSQQFDAGSYSQLTSEEAYEILGLQANASQENIIKAHKRLMQRLHPDRGGSDYLAAKINAAKDKLT